ncbi:Rhamnogalacturonan acetylesterase RhgT [Mariniflexile rhizosphaerae]|uniref:rhamnogalacturonan acetylesterase n=1 Tax=unclassified Mariniflexile TaxID=2643887 RepID=UPI000E332584|nr:rhamnogalacturonan acetylesterase [Mariniflexile sp. TRM1-10]AXP80142.1 Rhamnogalacturonan acetylesterase RhgT [Mariniflexile sp. TRM1-10]
MKNKNFYNQKNIAFYLAIMLYSTFAFSQNQKTKIYLVGDSTMCLYDDSRFPQAGWGMPFANFFDATTVEIENHAKGGRSTKSFLDENRWQPIVDSLKAGDYVLIQFGHNDSANSKSHPNRYASPEDYKKYMGKYITETREKNAKIILITPVTQRKYNANGALIKSHEAYCDAVLELGVEYHVPVIDLNTKSHELVEQMGEKFSRNLYMVFEPNELPRFPDGFNDNTHFNEFGARKIAEIVLRDIRAQKLELANYIVKPKSSK